jgi:CheY-like chemotaxis protein
VQTVLVLEDDTIMSLIRSVVGQNGYNILEARTAGQAFERFEESDAQVDLLIADATPQASSGIHVAFARQSPTALLNIIILYAYPSATRTRQDSAKLEELPSDSVIILQKPFVPATLLDSVHRLLGLPFSAAKALQTKAAS